MEILNWGKFLHFIQDLFVCWKKGFPSFQFAFGGRFWVQSLILQLSFLLLERLSRIFSASIEFRDFSCGQTFRERKTFNSDKIDGNKNQSHFDCVWFLLRLGFLDEVKLVEMDADIDSVRIVMDIIESSSCEVSLTHCWSDTPSEHPPKLQASQWIKQNSSPERKVCSYFLLICATRVVVPSSSKNNTNTPTSAWKSHMRHKCSLEWFRMCFELAFSLLILPRNKNLNYKQITSHGRTPSESLMIGFTILILFHVYLLLGIFSSSLAVLYVIGLKSLSEIAGTFPTEKHVKKLKKLLPS